MLMSTQ